MDTGIAPEIPSHSPLQACPVCEALIDISGQEPLSEIPCPGCGATITVRGIVDHFELIEVAGRGGMGVVYKARDTSLDRLVALKLLRKDHSDNAKLIEQLETEAAITASISHPYVVKVFSTGTDQGRFYLTMELVDRGSLDDLIRIQGRVAEAQVLEVASQIAQGLRAAQAAGLIHRDVKPGNILFADPHTAKIVDFGLAIFMSQEESVRGEIWGTPYYVAPEKLDDKPEDFRSDIYSLGATLFHALAGRPPFEAENASMVALKHLKAQPVSLQSFAPHVSSRTAYIINRTLLKDPEKRYQSYDELIEHLEYAREELMSGDVKKAEKRVVLENEQQQKAWGLITVIMIAVILVAGGLIYAFTRGDDTRSDAADEAAEAASPAHAARAKLIAGDPKGAIEDYRKILTQTKREQEDTNWLLIQKAIAELNAGQAADAKATISSIRSIGSSSDPQKQKLDAFFTDLTKKLGGNDPVSPSSIPEVNRGSYEMVSLLLFGLHDWQLGKVDDASAFLRQFRNATTAGRFAWIAELKPIASKYVDDITAFQMAVSQLKAANTPEKRALASDELAAIKGPFAEKARQAIEPFKKEIEEFEKLAAIPPADGLYRIVNKATSKTFDVNGRSRDDGAQVNLYDYNGGSHQQWFLVANPDGTFRFEARHSGKVLDIRDSSKNDDAQIRQMPWKDAPNQKWKLQPAGRGFFRLISVATGKALSTSATETSRLIQRAESPAREQMWKFAWLGGKIGDWMAMDIGRPPFPSKATLDAQTGAFTLKSSGPDIWGNDDNFLFVHKKISGDFEISARVVEIDHSSEWAKVGVMVRWDLATNARNASLVMTPAHGLSHQRRLSAWSGTSAVKVEPLPLPHWVKLKRTGDKIAGFRSIDGKTWTPTTSDEIKGLPAEIYAGIVSISHAEGVMGRAVIDNVSLGSTTP